MVKSGFFNSKDLDRLYYAEDVSHFISSLVTDGIILGAGTCLKVVPNNGLTVNIGAGKAWFDDSYLDNTAVKPLLLDRPDLVLPRIDAIVMDFDHTLEVRKNTILYIKGVPSSNPVRPTLLRSEEHNQYPLAFISVPANIKQITAAEITSMIGQSPTPYATSILQQTDISDLVSKWEAQFGNFMTESERDIYEWFNAIASKLGEEPAVSLQLQINEIVNNNQTQTNSIQQNTNNISQLSTQITNIEKKNNAQDKSITDIQSKNTNQDNRLKDLEDRQTIKYSVLALSNLPANRETDSFYFCY